jgi:glycosyl transferase family 1
MHVLWLSREDEFLREIKGLTLAFRRAGYSLTCLEPDTRPDVDIGDLIKKCPEAPSLIVHPEPWVPVLPRGLTEVAIPTVGIQCDVYAFTHRRLLYSMLFDYVPILHPGFEKVFQDAGHSRTITLPFAADPDYFFDSDESRVYEIASVGRLFPTFYKSRKEILSSLSREFKMNEWYRNHNYSEVPIVYRTSKVVINIPRDDFPTDVSMRFAEAMACGALFLTRMPSEMTALGFEENVHFCGYRHPGEIPEIARKYLRDEEARRRIAQAGRDKVLREHTYDVRIANLLSKIKQDNGVLTAPARSWRPSRVRLAYLDYFSGNAALDCAYDDLWPILKTASPETWKALELVARGSASRIRTHLKSLRGVSKLTPVKP